MAYMADFLNPYLENSVASDLIGVVLISGKKRMIECLSNWKEANTEFVLSYCCATHLIGQWYTALSQADGPDIGNISNY